MRTRTWCVALALLCGSAPATGQTVLVEADALARLSSESPRLRAIQSTVDVARAEAGAVGRWPNPRFTLNREAVAGVTEHMAMVSQSLPISGRRGLEQDAARAQAAASQGRADEAMRQVRAELRTAYARLAVAQAQEAEWSHAHERLETLAAALATREEAGDVAGYDRVRAERELADVEVERRNARAVRVRAQGELATFFAPGGDPSMLVAAIPASPAPRPPLPAVAELVQRARTTRGERAALDRDAQAATFAERAAARRLVPEPEIVAGTKSSNVGGGDVGSVLTLHATIPLFDRSRPERALAAARRSEAEARLILFDTATAAAVAGLRATVEERRLAADGYRASVTAAARLERIAQVSYDAGERGILELLDAYRGAAAARVRQLDLDGAARAAEIELAFVSGWEIE